MCLFAAIVLFAASMKLFGVAPRIRLVMAATREATVVMRSRTLDEREKEAAVQSAAIRVVGHALAILVRVALTLAVPFAFVALGSALGLYLIGDAMRVATTWSFIIGSTIVMVGALIVDQ